MGAHGHQNVKLEVYVLDNNSETAQQKNTPVGIIEVRPNWRSPKNFEPNWSALRGVITKTGSGTK